MAFVPLNDTTPINQYVATGGQTTFAYTWLAFDEADIEVYVNDVLKTLTTDYTISAVNQENGANVVFNSGLTLNDEVTITRNVAIQRTTGYTTSGNFKSDTLNVEQNKELAVSQQLERDIARTVRLSASSTVDGGNLILPTPVNDKALVWDGTDGTLKNSTSSVDSAAADAAASAAAAATSETNAATSETNAATSASNAASSASAAASSATDAANSAASVNLPTITTSHEVLQIDAAGTALEYGLIDTENLAAAAVETAKINDDAVTRDKIYSGAETTITASDEVLFADVSDSNNMKKDTVQGLLDLSTPTGTVIQSVRSTPSTGWLLFNGDSLGSAGSGADNAGAQFEDLYTVLWDNLSDSHAPVSGGRGASAAADFAANKTLTMPDATDRASVAAGSTYTVGDDSVGAATVASQGSVGSTGSTTLSVSQVPDLNIDANYFNDSGAPAGLNHDSTTRVSGGITTLSPLVNTTVVGATNGGGGSHSHSGGTFTGTPTSVVQPSIALYFHIKM